MRDTEGRFSPEKWNILQQHSIASRSDVVGDCIIDTVGPGTTLKPPLPRSDRIMHQNSLTFLASAAAVSLASRLASVVRRFLSSVSGTAICYDRG